MIEIFCEQVSPGLREADAILTLLDVHGRKHFLQIEKDLLIRKNGGSYLSVSVVHRDARIGAGKGISVRSFFATFRRN